MLRHNNVKHIVYFYHLGGGKIPLILKGDSNHAFLKTFFDVNGVSSLFQYFADVRILDGRGRSALWHAKSAGSKECADILRHNGCHDLGTMIPQVSRNDVFLWHRKSTVEVVTHQTNQKGIFALIKVTKLQRWWLILPRRLKRCVDDI